MSWSPEVHMPCAVLCPQGFPAQGKGSGPEQPHSCLQSSSAATGATTAGCRGASRIPGGCTLLWGHLVLGATCFSSSH